MSHLKYMIARIFIIHAIVHMWIQILITWHCIIRLIPLQRFFGRVICTKKPHFVLNIHLPKPINALGTWLHYITCKLNPHVWPLQGDSTGNGLISLTNGLQCWTGSLYCCQAKKLQKKNNGAAYHIYVWDAMFTNGYHRNAAIKNRV